MHTKQETCCFTGHRPDKLPWGYDETDPRCLVLKQRIHLAIRGVYAMGYRHFLCGMAQGCDLYFGESVVELRDDLPGIFLEAAIPCPVQADRWPRNARERYQALLDRCDKKTMISPCYTPYCMPLRNRYMVNCSSLLIAAYDGSPRGGTFGTVEYALKKGLQMIDLHMESLSEDI